MIKTKLFLLFLFSVVLTISALNFLPDTENLNANIGRRKGASGGCEEMLETFAYFSANFTYCAIKNARPIRLCTKCVTWYLALVDVYDEILEYPDSDGLCRDELFNLDRLQVVDSGFNYVTGLWNRASCDTCFKPKANGVPSDVQDDTVAHIFNASDVLTECINKNSSDACQVCEKDYLKMNELYDNLKADTGEISFCMDIVDLVNSTRSDWSGTLGCCNDRKKNEFVFLMCSTAVSLFPIVFYFLAYVFTSKKKHPIMPQNRWRDDEPDTQPLETESKDAE